MDGPGVVLMVLALAGLGLPVAGRPAIVGFIGRVSVSSSGAIPRTSYYLTAGTLPAHPPMEKMIELFQSTGVLSSISHMMFKQFELREYA